jgi:hypothetical protein
MMGFALLGQLSVDKVKEISLTLYNRATDSDKSCVYCLEFLGLIDSFDDVCVFICFYYYLDFLFIFLF